jgi:lysophospholipase L1-like esterase
MAASDGALGYAGGMNYRLHGLGLWLSLTLLCGCAARETDVGAASQSSEPAPAAAEQPWYEPEIRTFEAADRASPPRSGMVLFVGSSSVRMWETLERDMAPAPVLKRGFGGSRTGEVLAVFDRIVRPYEPRVIVYYCGDNDLGTDNTDSEGAAEGFVTFDRRARELWPDVRVLYIAIKPSVARWRNWDAMRRANEIVRAYCERTPGAAYLDIATPMLGSDGTPDPSLFLGDGLHLNAKGYAVWTGVVRDPVVRAWQETVP